MSWHFRCNSTGCPNDWQNSHFWIIIDRWQLNIFKEAELSRTAARRPDSSVCGVNAFRSLAQMS